MLGRTNAGKISEIGSIEIENYDAYSFKSGMKVLELK